MPNSQNLESELIVLHSKSFLRDQKHAGRCVANVLKECGDLILSKKENISLKDFERMAELYCRTMDCTASFKNYKRFPSSICASVNNQLVHGFATDYILKDGDLITVDFGATYNGAIADAARTWIYGTPKSSEHVRLLNTCRKALTVAQSVLKVGVRIGSIGFAIDKVARDAGFGLIINFGGHGIGFNEKGEGVLHAPPFIYNKSSPTEGVRIQNGLSIAIEPMMSIGSPSTKTLSDGWTVITDDVNCHYEDTFTVMDGEVHVITEVVNESAAYIC